MIIKFTDYPSEDAERFVRWFWTRHSEWSPYKYSHWGAEFEALQEQYPDEFEAFLALDRMGVELHQDDTDFTTATDENFEFTFNHS